MEKKIYAYINKIIDIIKNNINIIKASIIIFMITHLYMITNNWPNPDCMYGFYYNFNQLNVGRWFLKPACILSSPYYLPWVTGLIIMIYLIISCLLLISILKIKSSFGKLSTLIVVIAFPTISSIFSYMFLADGYILGFLLAIASVYFCEKGKKGMLLGSFLLCLSMGIYQIYISVAIILCIAKILIMINEDKKQALKLALNCIMMGIIACILYFIILNMSLTLTGNKLLSYQGINEIIKIDASKFIKQIPILYENVLLFWKTSKMFTATKFISIMHWVFIIIALFEYVYIYLNKKTYKNVFCNILTLLLVGCIPIGLGLLYLISSTTSYHMLMRLPWCILIVFIIAINEKFLNSRFKLKNIIGIVSVICTLTLGINFYFITNVGYMNMQQRYEKDYALVVRLVDRIEQVDEYNINMPVYIYGTFLDERNYPKTAVADDYILGMTGMEEEHILNTDFHYQQFMKNYLGVTIKLANKNQIEGIDLEKIRSMPTWPNTKSMCVINGVLVIKMNNE